MWNIESCTASMCADATEIQRALQMGGLHFDLTDIDAMLKAFDTEGNRVLDLNEFTRLHEFLTTVSQSFQQHDQVKQCVN